MKQPKVSIGIPVYNGKDTIKETIDSVLNQTFQDFEIIIVDNQSTDNTVEIVRQYTDPRIKLFINDTNIGIIPNWSRVMELSTGKYVKVLPADDFLYPTCLELQTKILDDDDEERKISLVTGRRNIINPEGKVLFTRGFSTMNKRMNGIKAINRVILSGANAIGEGGPVLFRKEVLEKTGYFNTEIFYVFDLDLWFKILLHGDFYYLNTVVSSFRLSSGSASVKAAKNQRDQYFQFIHNIFNAKEFKLNYLNFKLGLANTFFLTEVKKMLYKFVIK
jgi:glycosyltransferase involved in cell wall biosynthesis